MNLRKLLVLGSDYNTLNVVREAKKMGIYVIVTDLMETSPTKELADESWMISTTDIDMLEEKCKQENITALMFGASDFNISNCRQLAKRLALPIYCDSDKAWKIARDKFEFKKLCKLVGAPVAQDYYISDNPTEEELDAIKYPVVVKPADKSGNRGMSYCDNKKELIEGYKYAKSISDNKNVIIERKLHGMEYNVHYVIADGEINLLYFTSTHHQSGQAENLYSFKCTTPAHLKQYLEQVNDKVIEVLKKAECKNGIAWVDMIRDDDGYFYLLEMGYRFGGVMTYVPFEKVSGFNTIKWMLECALGIKHTKEDLPLLSNEYKECAASYHLFTKYDGIIDKIEGLNEIEKLPNVTIDMPKRAGQSVRSNACMGLIGIYGKNINDLCNTVKKINSLLKIKDAQNRDMIIYFDDVESVKQEYNICYK